MGCAVRSLSLSLLKKNKAAAGGWRLCGPVASRGGWSAADAVLCECVCVYVLVCFLSGIEGEKEGGKGMLLHLQHKQALMSPTQIHQPFKHFPNTFDEGFSRTSVKGSVS